MEKRSVTKWDSDPAEEFGFARQINPICTSSLSSLVPAVSWLPAFSLHLQALLCLRSSTPH